MPDLNDTAQRALGRAAKDLLENPLVTGGVRVLMDARERAVVAQEFALAQLNLPTAGDIERLTRRVRSVSQRLEALEDTLDELADRRVEQRLAAIEAHLAQIASALSTPA